MQRTCTKFSLIVLLCMCVLKGNCRQLSQLIVIDLWAPSLLSSSSVGLAANYRQSGSIIESVYSIYTQLDNSLWACNWVINDAWKTFATSLIDNIILCCNKPDPLHLCQVLNAFCLRYQSNERRAAELLRLQAATAITGDVFMLFLLLL